nr:AEC family transporter [Acidobacteriota bacterium]
AALPTMILILGMQVQRAVVPRRPVVSLTAVMVSLMIAPFVAMGVATALGITGEARQAVVILSSMPVAVSTTILAIQYDVDPEMVTSSVFLSTILSPLTLVPLIAWLS